MTKTKLEVYIDNNEQAKLFLQKFPILSAESFFEFGEEYYINGPAGSKFSERVFTQWIHNAVEKLSPQLITQSKLELIVEGVKKEVDLQLILRGTDHFLIEFKCNIDMIEKDIFKFIFLSNKTAKKSIFIWEYTDFSQSRDNTDSSYLKILNYFKINYNIDYFYFPLHKKDGKRYDQDALQQKIDTFIDYLKSTDSNTTA